MGSSKKVTVGYKYGMAQHQILLRGPVDKVTELIADNKIAWAGESSGGKITVNAKALFGGDDGEGGIVGEIELMMGGPTQIKSSLLQYFLGEKIPAYRGFVSAIFGSVSNGKYDSFYFGNSPYLKDIAWRCQRVFVRDADAKPQWYPSTAAISAKANDFDKYYRAEFEEMVESSTWVADLDLGGQVTFGTGYINDSVTMGFDQPKGKTGHIYWKYTFSPLPIETYLKLTIHFDDGGGVSSTGGLDIIDTDEMAPDVGYSTSRWYVLRVPKDTYISDTLTILVTDQEPEGTSSAHGAKVKLENYTLDDVTDMNPAHIIREVVTSEDYGFKFAGYDIDEENFVEVANRLYNEGMGLSFEWFPLAMPADEFIAEICRHIDASVYLNQEGLIRIKLIRDDYNADQIPVVDDSIILDIENISVTPEHELKNVVIAAYSDPKTDKPSSVQVSNAALVQKQGRVIPETINYFGFHSVSAVTRRAQNDLRALSNSLFSCVLVVNRIPEGLNIGDVFRLYKPALKQFNTVMRIADIDWGDGRRNEIRMTITEDVYSLPDARAVVPSTGWVDPREPASRVINRVVFELPYFELVQQQGQAAVDALLADNPDIGFFGAAAERRSSNAINAEMYVNEGALIGGQYKEAGYMDFSPATYTIEAIDAMTNTVVLAELPDDDVTNQIAQLGDELIVITDINESTLTATITRGVLDSMPSAHPAMSNIIFWGNEVGVSQTEYVSGETLAVSILPITSTGQLPLEEAGYDQIEMHSRAIRPFAPGQVKINNEYWPEELNGQISLSWSTRNRIQQTGGVHLGFYDNGVAPESGTTVTVKFFTEYGATPLHTQSGIESLVSEPWVTPGAGRYRVEAYTVRDGYESFSKFTHVFFTAGATLWTPELITPAIWINEECTLTEDAGAAIEVIDRSQNAFVFSQSAESMRPLVISNELNGNRVLRFDGSDDSLLGPSASSTVLSGATAAWCIMAIKSSSANASYRYPFAITAATDNNAQFLAVTSSTVGGTYVNRPGVGGRNYVSDGYSEMISAASVGTNWAMTMHRIKYTTKTGTVNVNGYPAESSVLSNMTAGTKPTGPLRPPRIGGDQSNRFSGDIAEVVFGTQDLSQGDVDRLFGYLAHRWGLTIRLPDNHPFKTVPPYDTTPEIKADFNALPICFGFLAAQNSGSIGVVQGPIHSTQYGMLLTPSPTLGTGTGLQVVGSSSSILIRLDGVTISAASSGVLSARIIDHKGQPVFGPFALINQSGYWKAERTGLPAQLLTSGEVYYVSIAEQQVEYTTYGARPVPLAFDGTRFLFSVSVISDGNQYRAIAWAEPGDTELTLNPTSSVPGGITGGHDSSVVNGSSITLNNGSWFYQMPLADLYNSVVSDWESNGYGTYPVADVGGSFSFTNLAYSGDEVFTFDKDNHGIVFSAANGIDFSEPSTIKTTGMRSRVCRYINGLYVVGGLIYNRVGGQVDLMTSPDLLTFTARGYGLDVIGSDPSGAAAGTTIDLIGFNGGMIAIVLMYAGADYGYNILQSTDNGATWAKKNPTGWSSSDVYQSFVVYGTDLIILGKGKTARTADLATWTTTSLPDVDVTLLTPIVGGSTIACMGRKTVPAPDNPSMLYIRNTAWISTDGTTFTQLAE